MTALIELEDVSLHFGGLRALDKLTLAVEVGEILAVIGPNGAGKTSMLNVITRVFDATSGRIRFRGQEITRLPRQKIAHLGIARTYQNIELFENASVLENLLLGRHRFGWGSWLQQLFRTPALIAREEAHRAAVEAVIERLGLSRWRNAKVAALPYGVRKMVELGRALAAEPVLLFLDEPASGLDPEETRELAFRIADIRADLGITVVMIEHDMHLVAAVADRVVCMAEGRILAMGRPEEVQRHPDVVAAYLGG